MEIGGANGNSAGSGMVVGRGQEGRCDQLMRTDHGVAK